MAGFPNAAAFWSASEAWYKSRLAAQEKRRAEGRLEKPSQALSAKAAAWAHQIGRAQARPTSTRMQGATLRNDGKLAAALTDLANAAMPVTAAAFDDVLTPVIFKAWRNWPVSSGLSKSLISLEYDATAGRHLRATISNSAPYLFYIAGQPHRDLERDARAALTRIGEQIVRNLAARGR